MTTPVHKAQKDQQVQLVPPDHKGRQELQVQQDPKAPQVPAVPWDPRDLWVRRATPVLKVRRATPDLWAPPGHKGLKVSADPVEPQVHKVNKAHRGQSGQLDLSA